MATQNQNQKPHGLPNPYAQGSLPNPYALAQSDAAAASNQQDEQARLDDKKSTAKLFHQPHLIRRPQAKGAPAVKKPAAPRPQTTSAPPEVKSAAEAPASAPAPPGIAGAAEARAAAEQRSLDYYKSTADDDAAILEARAEAQREERNRKKEEKKFKKMFGNWNPHQEYKMRYPTNLSAYTAMGAYQDKLDDFVGLIRIARRQAARRTSNGFASPDVSSPSPPRSPVTAPSLVFAPPSFDEPPVSLPSPSRPAVPVAQTADEAYEHRLRLAEQRTPAAPAAAPPSPPADAQPPTPVPNPMFAPPSFKEPADSPPPVPEAPVAAKANKPTIDIAQQILKAKERAAAIARAPPPPPPPATEPPRVQSATPPPPPPAPAYSATISAPPVHYSATISAPPVHYARPVPGPKDVDEVQERPAKKQKTKEPPKPTKAELMMAKMGYIKGKGLGKNSDGVTTHLEVKARKDQGSRQVRDEFGEDSSRTIKSAQVFDITGGLRAQGIDHGPFGEPSRVIVAWGCIDGVDLAADAERDDGGIRQEMGDTFNNKFGEISRIHVDLAGDSRPVYIQFKDPLCALNAVNRFHEGYEFQGRRIVARFYDELKFNALIYDH